MGCLKKDLERAAKRMDKNNSTRQIGRTMNKLIRKLRSEAAKKFGGVELRDEFLARAQAEAAGGYSEPCQLRPLIADVVQALNQEGTKFTGIKTGPITYYIQTPAKPTKHKKAKKPTAK